MKKQKEVEQRKTETRDNHECEIFNSISEALYIQDREGVFVDVNTGAEKMYGYERKDFIGRTPEFLSAPGKNNLDETKKYIEKTFTTGEPSYFEFWGKKKDGQIFPKEVVLNKGVYNGQEVIVAIGRDISERKAIEETLRESEGRYRNLYNNSPTGIFRTTPDGKVIMANSTLIKMLGYDSLEDIANRNLEINFYAKGFSRKDFRDKIEKFGEVIGFETALLRKDKSSLWVRENSRAYKDNQGNVLYYEGTLEDITEKKLAEDALRNERLLFIGGPVIIIKWKVSPKISDSFQTNNHITIDYISPNVTQTLGYFQEELVNNTMHFYSLIHPDDVERVFNEATSFINRGEDWYSQEYRLKEKSGNYRWYFDFTRIIRDDEGRIINYHGYLFDISDRKAAEEALVKSEKQLRDLNTMKDKFFSVIAHDLRSPFQGLLGMASILVDEEFELDEKERSEFTKKLYEGLKTQFALLDNLLTWSRVQRGVIEFVPSLNDLTADILETGAILQAAFEKKEINFINELPNKLTAFYDKNMIATVIRNLLSNAIKFTKEGGIITVSAYENNDDIIVAVKDSGVGIPEEHIGKLFRIDTLYTMRGTNDEGGTGLGLILCKEFVERHSGRIWAESQIEKGSTFSFTIPKKKEN